MKKGFTLVELLAVITVLAVVGLIAIPTVNHAINSSKQKAYNAQIKELINAAKSWSADNISSIDDENDNYVPISTLISEGYIASEEVINPLTDESFNGCIKINYISKYKNYNYEYLELASCTE